MVAALCNLALVDAGCAELAGAGIETGVDVDFTDAELVDDVTVPFLIGNVTVVEPMFTIKPLGAAVSSSCPKMVALPPGLRVKVVWASDRTSTPPGS